MALEIPVIIHVFGDYPLAEVMDDQADKLEGCAVGDLQDDHWRRIDQFYNFDVFADFCKRCSDAVLPVAIYLYRLPIDLDYQGI